MQIISITNEFSPAENIPFQAKITELGITPDETIDAYKNGRHPYLDIYGGNPPCLIKVEEIEGVLQRTDYESDINKLADFKERKACKCFKI